MKLAIDATNISSGGGLNHLVNLLANLDIGATAFSDVYVWASSRTLQKLTEKPWLHHRTNTMLDGNLPSRTWWKLLHFTREVEREGCDLIFAPGGSYTGGFYPFVTMSRNMLPFEWREMRRYGVSLMFLKLLLLRIVQSHTYRRADGLIFLSQFARETVVGVTGELKAAQEVIPHGINPGFLAPVHDNRNKVRDVFNLIYVSIIDVYKHQWHVINAVEILRDWGYEVCVEFIGPSRRKAFRKFEKTRKRADPDGQWAFYRGNVENNKLPGCYARADICLFASSCENLPNILLEGMASGLPIACSSKQPMPEILKQAGVYFDPEDPEDIAKALRPLLDSEELRTKLSQSSRAIAAKYTWQSTATATFAFLEKACLKTQQPLT